MPRRALSIALVSLVACAGAPPTAAPAPVNEVNETDGTAPPKSAGRGPDAAAACFATANATRARFSGEPAKVTVKHVLVKWKGARNAPTTVTRTREEACLRAIEARDKIREGADFEAIVKEYSDEAGAATRGGSIGSVERKEVAKPFADAAFELSLNMLSDVVETEFGFHVIMRTE